MRNEGWYSFKYWERLFGGLGFEILRTNKTGLHANYGNFIIFRRKNGIKIRITCVSEAEVLFNLNFNREDDSITLLFDSLKGMIIGREMKEIYRGPIERVMEDFQELIQAIADPKKIPLLVHLKWAAPVMGRVLLEASE